MTAAPPGDPTRFRILYVCAGNVCRSVLAERLTRAGLATRLGDPAGRFHTGSAGSDATPGQPIHPYVRDILLARGADAGGFASRRLTAGLVGEADLVLAATVALRDRAIALAPVALRRTFTIRELARLVGPATAAGAGAEPGDPVARARWAVAAAQAMRGRMPYQDPEADDLADPVPTPAAFGRCASDLAMALDPVLDALCPARIPV
jgi:protein-tyrosine phosphatase